MPHVLAQIQVKLFTGDSYCLEQIQYPESLIQVVVTVDGWW